MRKQSFVLAVMICVMTVSSSFASVCTRASRGFGSDVRAEVTVEGGKVTGQVCNSKALQ